MKFFRIKPEYDGHFVVFPSGMQKLVKHEIYTYVEMRKYGIDFGCADELETSKRGNIYWCGHRFMPDDYPVRRK